MMVAVTKEDRRYFKQLSKTLVPPELFGIAANAINAMRDADGLHQEDGVSHIIQAFKQAGIDPLAERYLLETIVFRIEALQRTFEQMSKQEMFDINNGGEAMDERIIAAGASEPLIPFVQDGFHDVVFDLDGFRKALGLQSSSVT